MLFLQKKRENLRKRNKTMAAVFGVIMLTLATAGCGRIEEPIPVELSSGNMEELQDDAVSEIEDDPKEAAAGDADSDSEDVSDGEARIEAVESAELDGNVQSIGTDSFVVARAETRSEGDAQYMVSAAPGYEDEEDLITVHMNQNCVWEFKTVKNGGVNSEDISTREGSFSDLQGGMAINSKGNWQDDGSFLADSIVMMIFM